MFLEYVGIEQTVATPNTAAGYKIPRWKFFASQMGFAGHHGIFLRG